MMAPELAAPAGTAGVSGRTGRRKRGRVPLAWKNLTHDPRRLAVAVSGVGFAVLLMFMQTGFRNALFDSTVALVGALNGDLVITNALRYTVSVKETFTRRRLVQALASPGVRSAVPLYIEGRIATWKNVASGRELPIRVLAFDPADQALLFPEVSAAGTALDRPDAVLFDSRSKPEYHPAAGHEEFELSGRKVRIVGTFSLGTDFANDGNLIVSSATYARTFKRPRAGDDGLGEVDLGLVRLADGADAEAVQEELSALLPDDVAVFTLSEFADQEIRFWQRSTPVGYVFGFGMALGFLVGVIICYQILYADIDDHMPEYATLKAMGYPTRYFIGLVLKSSLWLSVLGFVPGLAVSWGLYVVVERLTGLLMEMTWPRGLLVLGLTAAMCTFSGCLAMRRLLAADPAELY
jgi:putative ABC transport system permease protein